MRPLGFEPRTQSLKLLILPLNYTLFFFLYLSFCMVYLYVALAILEYLRLVNFINNNLNNIKKITIILLS